MKLSTLELAEWAKDEADKHSYFIRKLSDENLELVNAAVIIMTGKKIDNVD